MKSIAEIKNGTQVMSVLTTELDFYNIQCKACLSRQATQKALADLTKHGYVHKNRKGLWAAVREVAL